MSAANTDYVKYPDPVKEWPWDRWVLGRGVTRTVFQWGRWAVKVPRPGFLLRGWLANQSEWRQRWRDDVARPVFSLNHFALVMPMAEFTLADAPRRPRANGQWPWPLETLEEHGYNGDEAKPSSWGFFRDSPIGTPWLLIDFDRAWDGTMQRRGLLNRVYYWNQARLARKWSRLPSADNQPSVNRA